MRHLELTRSPEDRRNYSLEGVGTLILGGLFSRRAVAEANGDSWQLTHAGLWGRRVLATDASGAVVGEFRPRDIRRGGTLFWAGRELALRPASGWRERYALTDRDRELVVLDGKGWGRRPVKVTTADARAVEPGLLLFAAFVVRGLADDAGAATGAASSSATAGG